MFKSVNGGKLPQAKTKYSAGYDVYANEDVEIHAGETVVISLGIKIDLSYIKQKLFLQNGFDEFDEIDLAKETHPQEFKSWLSSLDTKNDNFEFEAYEEENDEYFYHCIDYNGVAFEDFLKTHYLGLYLRSSLGAKGLILPNGVGVIDIDYEGELKMIIHNPITNNAEIQLTQQDIWLTEDYPAQTLEIEDASVKIKKGERIGQIIIHRHDGINIMGYDFREAVQRNGGLGSTNKI